MLCKKLHSDETIELERLTFHGPEIHYELGVLGFDGDVGRFGSRVRLGSSIPSSGNHCRNHHGKHCILCLNRSRSWTSLGNIRRIHIWMVYSLREPECVNRAFDFFESNDGGFDERARTVQPLEGSGFDSFCSDCNMVLTSVCMVPSNAHRDMGILACHGVYHRASHTKMDHRGLQEQKSGHSADSVVVSCMDCTSRRGCRNWQ